MNTAYKQTLHRRASSFASSPNKPSPLQIRVDDQHTTFKDVQIYDSPAQPNLLRKKTGEVVRPVLKFRASKSEPSTPTCSKNVRFDTHLEHVRLFLRAETPAAVVEDAIADDNNDGDDGEVDNDERAGLLTFSLPNWPLVTTTGSQGKTVHVNFASLGQDRTTFIGRVQVQNLAYHKRVDVHYTFDFWKTICEVQANYKDSAVSKSLNDPSRDNFTFSIPLAGKVGGGLRPEDEQTTMYFAVRYKVNGREYWDNNNGSNYQVEFKYAAVPSPALPRPAPAKSATRWNGSGSGNGSSNSTSNIGKDSTREFGVSPPSFSTSPDLTSIPGTKSATKKKSQRYDFNSSINAAKKNSSGKLPSYFNGIHGAPAVSMIDGYPVSIYTEDTSSSSIEHISVTPAYYDERGLAPIPMAKRSLSEKSISKEATGHYTFGTLPINCPRPNANSPTYFDLVQKYCFYSGSPYSSSPPAMITS